MPTTTNIGPCGCCGVIYDCECFDITTTEVKVTLSGFGGDCSAWNGVYIFATPGGRSFTEDFGDITIDLIQTCTGDFWGQTVIITAGVGCSFSYEVLDVDEDLRFHCGGGTLVPGDVVGGDQSGCHDCTAGSVAVEISM